MKNGDNEAIFVDCKQLSIIFRYSSPETECIQVSKNSLSSKLKHSERKLKYRKLILMSISRKLFH